MVHRPFALSSAALMLLLATFATGCSTAEPERATTDGARLATAHSRLEQEDEDSEVYGGSDSWYSQGNVTVTTTRSGGGGSSGGVYGGGIFGGSGSWYSLGNVTVTTSGGGGGGGGAYGGPGATPSVSPDDNGEAPHSKTRRKYACFCMSAGSAGADACTASTAWEQTYSSGAAASADVASACAHYGQAAGYCMMGTWEGAKLEAGCPTCAPAPVFQNLTGASGQFVWLSNEANVKHFIAQYDHADALTLFSQLKSVAAFYDSGSFMDAANAFINATVPKELSFQLEKLEMAYAAGTDQFAIDYTNHGAQGGLIVLVDEDTDSFFNVGGADSLVKLTYRIFLRTNKVQIGEYHIDTWFDGAGQRVGELHHLPRDYRVGAPAPTPCP